MTLLLFDIDGTLLRVNGGVHRAVTHAVENVTGKPLSTDGVSFSGRTDLEIFRDVLVKSGVSHPDDLLNDVIAHYADVAQDTIQPDHVETLPGVPPLLSQLGSRNDVFLGLVTGNVEAIAYHKLRRAGLADYFPVGAFGSDHADRSELPPIALRRAADHVGQPVSADRTVIIGDTRHDIHCAHAAGIRSVAVCTGRFSRTELAVHTPDVLLNNLSDASRFIEQVLEI
jgi:phosphoglycolate phosphatase-like HAD superfamily hydrolase